MAAKIKDIHIHKSEIKNFIEIHFEFTNGWNETKVFRLDDNRYIIEASLHAFAEQIGRAMQIDT